MDSAIPNSLSATAQDWPSRTFSAGNGHRRRSHCADVHRHLPNVFDDGMHDVAGLDRTHALWRATEQDVARQERIKRGCKFDQLWNAQDQITRVGFLPEFAVNADLQVEM